MRQDTIYDNYEQLISHGLTDLRKDALDIAESGIKAVIPYDRTLEYISYDGSDEVGINGKTLKLSASSKIFVVGAGKGSFPIAKALDEIFGSRIDKGFVAVKEGEKRKLPHIEIYESSHPFPDERSEYAAKRIKEICDEAREGDLVFACVTGGSSALVNLPADGITMDELKETNRLLLRSGADIVHMNAVRKHLCNLKGGRIVQYSQPATVITLTLDTNTPGMPWPDLCLPDPSTFQDAIDVLSTYDLWDKVALSVKQRLLRGVSDPSMETLKTLEGMNQILLSCGNQSVCCQAAADKAAALGYRPYILSACMDGEAKDMGIFLAGMANEIVRSSNPFEAPCALISGGETTITITGKPEPGGPNQESVFGFTKKLRQKDRVAFVCLDTDGTDGPTDIAGGIGDGLTNDRMAEAGLSYDEIYTTHCTYRALKELKDDVITGNTGTNVMNIRVVVIR